MSFVAMALLSGLVDELRDEAVLKWDTELWGENPADFGRK